MDEEKKRILTEFKKLGESTKDLKNFLEMKEYKDLCNYYYPIYGLDSYNIEQEAIATIISEVEGIYVKGNIIEIMQHANYTYILVAYDYICIDPHTVLTIIVKNKDKKYLEGIRPQDGVKVYLDFEYIPDKHIEIYATKIVKMDKMRFPIKICPICKQIYDRRDDEHFCQFSSTLCDFCSTDKDPVSLVEVDNTDDLYAIIDSE